MEWSREDRYRRLEDIDHSIYKELEESAASSPYRQKFHVQPKTGLLNDPNGFSYFNGCYHLFYQWFPLGPVHGVKYWYHVSSDDLVNWKDEGIALSPDTKYDSHGVFSGSGIVAEDKLYLFYTGNTRTEDWTRIPYQCIAIMEKNGKIKKQDNPIVKDSPDGYTDNFRDPKVFKQGDMYICLVGAETENHQGRVVYYTSENLREWHFKGNISTSDNDNAGFMWECPDYFELEQTGILLFSPQGMVGEGDCYQNIFQSGYLIGDPIDFETGIFHHREFTELDRGFDFYAPQTMQDPKGRRILIGWFGLPGVDCVTDEDGWAHCLTLPRELILKDNHLYQCPVSELDTLRKSKIEWTGELDSTSYKTDIEFRTFEWNIDVNLASAKYFGIKFRVGQNEETVFSVDKEQGKLILDRSRSGRSATDEYGTVRRCDFSGNKLKIRLFLDESSVEIFVNDGYEVFSSRLFTSQDSNAIELFSEGKVSYQSQLWEL